MNYKFIIDNIVLPITPKEIKTKIKIKTLLSTLLI